MCYNFSFVVGQLSGGCFYGKCVVSPLFTVHNLERTFGTIILGTEAVIPWTFSYVYIHMTIWIIGPSEVPEQICDIPTVKVIACSQVATWLSLV